MRPTRHFLFAHPAHFLALGFGSGLARVAPGTWGTLAALPLYFLLANFPAPVYWALTGLALLAGVWICDITGRHLGVQDHGGIVWDEIAAFLTVLPFATPSWWGWLLAFLLFRLFDIWKPFPIAWCDSHIKGGFGVMFDDVLAAGYSILCLWGMAAWL